MKEGPSGLWYVQADRRVLSGDNPKVWGKQIESFINTRIRHGEDVRFPTEDGHVTAFTDRSAYKLMEERAAHIIALPSLLP